MNPNKDFVIIENIFPASFCLGLIEWAESNGFDKENKLIFEDETLADFIWGELFSKLPENYNLKRIGLNDIFRIHKLNDGQFPVTDTQDYIRYKNEGTEYQVLILLNSNNSLKQKNKSFKTSTLLALEASKKIENNVSSTLYYLESESIIRIDRYY
jgi:hypothetical protein